MSDDHHLQPLAKLRESSTLDERDEPLAAAFEALYPEEPLPPCDEGGWERLEDSVLALSRRRRALDGLRVWFANLGWGWRFSSVAAAAIALLLVGPWGVWRFLTPKTEVLPRFEVMVAEHASTGLSLLSGVRLEVEGGRAKVDQADPGRTRVTLLEGRLLSRVPKLPKGDSFVVGTDDCEVIVHGTRFLVVKLEGSTRVEVLEGVVEVRSRFDASPPRFLSAHEELVVPGRAQLAAELAARVRGHVFEVKCEGTQTDLLQFLELHEPGADLSGAQYLLGLCAAQRGELSTAVQMLERAAESTSDPVRADNALARAAQLSTSVGADAGMAAWRRYLQKFPAGLHHVLAERELRRLQAAEPR